MWPKIRFGSHPQEEEAGVCSWVKLAWHSVPTINILGQFGIFLNTNIEKNYHNGQLSKIAPQAEEQR